MGFPITVPSAIITISTDKIKSVTMADFILSFSRAKISASVKSCRVISVAIFL